MLCSDNKKFIEILNICFKWVYDYICEYFNVKYDKIIITFNNKTYGNGEIYHEDEDEDTIDIAECKINDIVYNWNKNTFIYNNDTLKIEIDNDVFKIFYYLMSGLTFITNFKNNQFYGIEDENDNIDEITEDIDISIAYKYYKDDEGIYISYRKFKKDILKTIDKLNMKYKNIV